MAAQDPQTLFSQGSCYSCFGAGPTSEILALALLDQIEQKLSPAPPVIGDFRISLAGDTRISAVGNKRIWQ